MQKEVIQYGELLKAVKSRIRQAQTKAVLSANAEMIMMYWDIGRMIDERQQREGWGAGVLRRLSEDLNNELPEVKGFSERNLKRMTQFYREYPALFSIGPQAVAQLPKNEKGEFKPDYAGKINFYCNVVDDLLKHETDNPTIGLILCQDKNKVIAEYALRGMNKPIGISEYELTRALPESLKSALPTIEQIESELGREIGEGK
jgi:hypothetical protein